MFVDASVIVAILNKEPGWEELIKRLAEVQTQLYVSPLVRFEAALSIARAGAESTRTNRKPIPQMLATARDLVEEFVTEIAAREMPISTDIGDRAIEASIKFGKAVGHPADLNFGDCFAYACAKAQGVGLLYKGDDFAKTDLA
jgi:ribonuclease VapC